MVVLFISFGVKTASGSIHSFTLNGDPEWGNSFLVEKVARDNHQWNKKNRRNASNFEMIQIRNNARPIPFSAHVRTHFFDLID